MKTVLSYQKYSLLAHYLKVKRDLRYSDLHLKSLMRSINKKRFNITQENAEALPIMLKEIPPCPKILTAFNECSRANLLAAFPEHGPEHLCVIEVTEPNHNSHIEMEKFAPLHTSFYQFDSQKQTLTHFRGNVIPRDHCLMYIGAHGSRREISGVAPLKFAQRFCKALSVIEPNRKQWPHNIHLNACNGGTITAYSKFYGISPATEFYRVWSATTGKSCKVTAYDGSCYANY